jgi:regulator of sigma E protease
MVITLIIAFLSLIALMVIHEFGHFIIAKKFGVKVEEFGIGYPPRIFGKKIGDTIYSINWIPLGAFVRIYGEEGGVDDYRSFSHLAIWKRVLIVIGGVVAFWIASIVIFSVVFAIGADVPVGDQDLQGVSSTKVTIVSVSTNSPAEKAGLKAGDVLLQAESLNIEVLTIDKVKDFQDFTKSHAGEQIDLKVQRGEEVFNVSLSPRVTYTAGEGAVGVGLERMATVIQKQSWYMAPIQGTIYCWDITVRSVQGLYDIFKNLFLGKGMPQGSEFAGPLGITVFLARAVDYGIGFFLYFIGSISVFIALFNLFPIPALDGGKLVFLLIEKILKRPVSQKIEQNITVIFFFLLISMSIFITIKFDVPRFSEFLKSSLQR